MNEEEQIKKFWEWCGWHLDDDGDFKWWYKPEGGHLPLGEEPQLDLNNLFKWAIKPKLDGYMMFTGEDGIHFIASRDGQNYEAIASKEEDAAFVAIYKVMEEK